VRYLLDGGDSVALNLGTGDGTTVSELLTTIERVSGRRFPVEHVERRDGGSPALVADNAKAKAVLGWAPAYDLDAIVETSWNWHSRTNLAG
jgi:UDP-glucose 4-epimerase